MWEAIIDLRSTVTGFAKRFRTEELCVGDTCVNENQLKTLLENKSVPPPSGGETDSDMDSDHGVVTDEEDTEPPVIELLGNNPSEVEEEDLAVEPLSSGEVATEERTTSEEENTVEEAAGGEVE